MVQQHVLATLPNHAHQIIGAFLSYSTLFGIVSPQLSAYLIPNRYRSFPQRTRINWNVRIVSLVQAILICSLSLRVIFTDKERPGATVADRLWAYSPSGGRIQAFAAGYFIWDLLLSTWYIQILGIGSLTHAICALSVTMLGFRPFANYYGLNYVFYELSTPFLNFHWFMDKTGMSGTKLQFANGVCLLTSFFGCRVLWGLYQSIHVYMDFWDLWTLQVEGESVKVPSINENLPERQYQRFDLWLMYYFITANTILSGLNLYWFSLMVKSFRRRTRNLQGPVEGRRHTE